MRAGVNSRVLKTIFSLIIKVPQLFDHFIGYWHLGKISYPFERWHHMSAGWFVPDMYPPQGVADQFQSFHLLTACLGMGNSRLTALAMYVVGVVCARQRQPAV